jgi:hypothetical protein
MDFNTLRTTLLQRDKENKENETSKIATEYQEYKLKHTKIVENVKKQIVELDFEKVLLEHGIVENNGSISLKDYPSKLPELFKLESELHYALLALSILFTDYDNKFAEVYSLVEDKLNCSINKKGGLHILSISDIPSDNTGTPYASPYCGYDLIFNEKGKRNF